MDSDTKGGLPLHSKAPETRLFHARFALLASLLLVLLLHFGISGWLKATNTVRRGLGDWRALPVGTVEWGLPCANALPDAECGYIVVPTDYFNTRAGVTKIALGRYRARTAPRKGIVLTNPGGPGASGLTYPLRVAQSIQDSIIGRSYDIVGFDPRGVGDTEPHVECFGPGERKLFIQNTVLDRGFDVKHDVDDPALRSSLLRQASEMEALSKSQFALCDKVMGDALRYMGTTLVARDVDFITTALEGKDALINYIGTSYGSALGQYIVNMFPDRVGRVLIDGILDADAWANVPNYQWYTQWLSSVEQTYSFFLEGCSKAGPDPCALAHSFNENPEVIRARLESFFDGLYERPLPVSGNITGIITAGLARKYLFENFHVPPYTQVAKVLASAMAGDGGPLLADYKFLYGRVYHDVERQAISCNDAVRLENDQKPSAEVFIDELLGTLRNVTRFAMTVVTTSPDSWCHHWPVEPPERFTGPWNHTLKNPILVLTTTGDPITPIDSALRVKSALGDSARLAILDAPGHSTWSVPSRCIENVTLPYFASGMLPKDGIVCQPDVPPFPSVLSEYDGEWSIDDRRMLRKDAQGIL